MPKGKRLAKTTSYRAKVFKNGGSQAVRLPKECRVEGTEVVIRKVGRSLVIEPVSDEWGEAFRKMFFEGPPHSSFPARQQPRWDDRL